MGNNIAKNTFFLYIRMILVMIVNLYTVRVVLNTLGTTDYGIFNLVGGIVAMFSFITSSLSSASQRFFSFEIGKGNGSKLSNIFNVTMSSYILLSVILLVIFEIIGFCLLDKILVNVPVERLSAANWVFQFSIITLIFTFLTIPYNAFIIAQEEMNIYAYISILEIFLKLILVYLLIVVDYDKLKVYSILTCIVSFIVTNVYRIYCIRKYVYCRFRFFLDKKLFKEIVGFSSWSLFDSMSSVFNAQGINIVLGTFLGPSINAARGLAYQASVTVNQFVLNFMTATRPQIIKKYALNEIDAAFNLMFMSSKFSFFLLLMVCQPIIVEPNLVFEFWLGNVPEYLPEFTRLILFAILIDVISYPLTTVVQATGRIKTFSLVIGLLRLLIIPLAYFVMQAGYAPTVVFEINIILCFICLIIRLFFLKNLLGLVVLDFFNKVIARVLLVAIFSFLFSFYISDYIPLTGVLNLVITTLLIISSCISFIFIFGLNKLEKLFLIEKVKKIKEKYV